MSFDRQGVADHASQLANTIQGNLKRSLEALGVVSVRFYARIVRAQRISPAQTNGQPMW